MPACGPQGVGDSAFVGQNQLFPFSTVVFTSWDFHLTDVDASRNLRSSIRNQLKEMVNDAALDDVVHTWRSRAQSFVRKVLDPRTLTIIREGLHPEPSLLTPSSNDAV